MSNADQASEPTMEEILSSIRKIISDDDKGGKPAPVPAAKKAAAKPEPEPEPEPEVEEEASAGEELDQSGADDIFDLTEVADEPKEEVAEEPAAAAEDVSLDEWGMAGEAVMDPEGIDDVDFSEPEPEPAPVAAAAPEPRIPAPEPPRIIAEALEAESLLSNEASAAASSAFGHLANTLLSRNGDARTIEDLVQEMLRPMLKSWLDENLPIMVERLVREEIERVSRRR